MSIWIVFNSFATLDTIFFFQLQHKQTVISNTVMISYELDVYT